MKAEALFAKQLHIPTPEHGCLQLFVHGGLKSRNGYRLEAPRPRLQEASERLAWIDRPSGQSWITLVEKPPARQIGARISDYVYVLPSLAAFLHEALAP